MKKAMYILLGIILLAMFFSNTSESEFQEKINNSGDPLSDYYMHRLFKNATPIFEGEGRFFSPVFNMDFTNLGLFSIASVESGWAGTLRIDGAPLNEFVSKISNDKYFLIFGKEFEF